MIIHSARLFLLVLLTGASALAHAAPAQPVDITADKLAVDHPGGQAVFSGNVQVVQGAVTLTADTLTATYSSGIDNLVASGNVKVTRSQGAAAETATGRRATYKPATEVLTMEGGVTLVRGGNTLRGQTLTYNLKTGQINLGGGGRVTGSFQGAGPASGQ